MASFPATELAPMGVSSAPYGVAGSGVNEPTSVPTKTDYWSLQKLKKSYLAYLDGKSEEIDEQKNARRYRHGAHWTAAQIKVLNDRKQPVVTYNRIGRKINGTVGLVEKLRQDPKAYARTPQHEQGAELVTATIRFVLDKQKWKSKSPTCTEKAAVDGIGGIELELIKGDQGDPDVGFEVVDEGYFYDPRSTRLDFSDAIYEGVGKFVDVDTAIDMLPDHEDDIRASITSGSDLSANLDKDEKWARADDELKCIRLVDLWYKHEGGWCWALFTGAKVLMEGKSPFMDEDNKPCSKFIMFSASVDHDGDRYGFVRDLKSANDEINQRRSKGLHELNVRRVIGEVGAFDDVEKARKEAARPDGFVLRNKGFEAEFDDSARLANIEGQFKFLEDAKNEIENFGPNPALIGQGIENKSGRAISLLQQAGIAELGPFILSHRGWKIRVYRAIWNAVQRHWKSERWIRVTDDEGLAQFVQVNQLGVDPNTGMPTIINALGSLDVDIILDEGPDQVNMMGDAYDTLTALAGQGAQIPPEVLIELAPIQSSVKKRLLEMLQQAKQADPMAEQMKQITVQGEAAKIKETESKTMLNMAKAQEAQMPEPGQMMQPQEQEVPIEVQTEKTLAEIRDILASADLKRAQAHKVGTEAALMPADANLKTAQAGKAQTETALMPAKMQQDADNAEADRKSRIDQIKAKPKPTNGANK